MASILLDSKIGIFFKSLLGVLIGFSVSSVFLFILTAQSPDWVFPGVVAVATLIYAWLTWALVEETVKMRKAQTNPNVSITIEPREEWVNFIDMKIENVGLGPAYNIKFKVLKDFEYILGKKLSELGFIKSGLRYLAPKQKIQFFLTSFTENPEEKKKPFEIEASYENSVGNKCAEKFTLSLADFIGLAQLGEPPLQIIAKEIKGLAADMHHFSTGFRKLKTVVYTKKEIDKMDKAFLKKSGFTRKKNASTKK